MATKTVWKVKFCVSCFHAFDVAFRGQRTPGLCEECRAARKHKLDKSRPSRAAA